MENPTSGKLTLTDPKKSGNGKVIAIVIAVFVLFALLVVGIAATVVWGMYTNINSTIKMNNDTPIVEEQNKTSESSKNSTDNTTTTTASSEYKLYLEDNNYITVPNGWKVTRTFSNWRSLTTDEQNDYIKEINHGLWPIHESSAVEISNSNSQIKMVTKAIFIPGSTDFLPQALGSDYEVIKKPEGGKKGIARKKLTASSYEYVRIYKNENPELFEGEYLRDPIEFLNFEFQGANGDLDTATKVFTEACIDNTSNWCSK